MEASSASGATDFGPRSGVRPERLPLRGTIAPPEPNVSDTLNAAALTARTLGSPALVAVPSRPWVVEQARIAALLAQVSVEVTLDEEGACARFAPRPRAD